MRSLARSRFVAAGFAAILAGANVGCGSSGTQSLTNDAGGDRTAPPLDAGSAETAPSEDSNAAASCPPTQVSSFTPVPTSPLIAAACTDAQIDAIVRNCFDPAAPPGACQMLDQEMANLQCLDCVFVNYSKGVIDPAKHFVPQASPSWGPFIEVLDSQKGGLQFVNVGGCIAIADPASTECGEAFSALLQCEVQSCGASCSLPATGASDQEQNADSTAYSSCVMLSGDNACYFYANATYRDCVAAMSGPANFCFTLLNSSNPSDGAYTKLIRQQCGMAGASATDAGVEDAGHVDSGSD